MCEDGQVCAPQLDCGLGDVVCGAKNAFNQTMAEVANSLLSAARDALKAVGQIWLSSAGIDVKAHFDRYHPENVPDVNIHAGDHPANVTGINDVMGSVAGCSDAEFDGVWGWKGFRGRLWRRRAGLGSLWSRVVLGDARF